MYNKWFFAGMILLAATSCSNENDLAVNIEEQAKAPVTVHVNDFSMSVSDFVETRGLTRAAQDVADYSGVAVIDLAFYNGTTEVLKNTQMRSDASTYTTFGEFSCSLPIGTYTMVVVGRGYTDGDVFTLTSPTTAAYTSERARETFCTTQTVNVTAAGAAVEATLSRVMSKLAIRSTDAATTAVARMRTTYAAGSKSFNPTTGLATDNNGFSLTNSIHAAEDGTLAVQSYLFLASDEQNIDVTIEALDASDNVLFTKTVANVPFKRNRCTILRGAIFTASSSSASFQVETAWLDDEIIDF